MKQEYINKEMIVTGKVIASGEVRGEIVGTNHLLSFWGGFDPVTGKIIDRHHPLCGETLTGKIFVLPRGKGSSTGSPILLDAIMLGNAPAGLIMNKADVIISLGIIVCEEFFKKGIPIIVLNNEDFSEAVQAKEAVIKEGGTVTLLF
ncbi:aconitase X swivel domain-containing protein [Schinkia azotoformans]|uniref:aconitase X swivel domain-containing protein n=1 Tax=Schinkia azotoformans TaxID=1454 RepID=UPI002DBEED11|nr:DUF126 domain-containing protein [Schinkia azotoformans]MEC1715134.1 DUF126 domain-containing protein [Schinkia azotoformans]MEC1739816.1 DUF126 domain-containing protein [Schinkia azotoformans]MEC1745559.1 DUF126 domain-containing protein [Schinkia azotoformans]MEC1760058.1 DUF126 domain-containing protein [Schinkia azotoformans]MEC1765059.1 DUF126 domain-containing protein [Schinkia azotoformans]